MAKIDTLLNRLDRYRDAEIAKWIARGKEHRAAAIEDKVATIRVLGESLLEDGKATKVSELIISIELMFQDSRSGRVIDKDAILTLSTVHRSKGREWHRVYLLGPNRYIPSPWARQEWQVQQEKNLIYVAITRTKHELVNVIVPLEDKQK